MRTDVPAAKTIDEYIARCEPDVRGQLKAIRAAIRKAAPKAEEVISYRMPAFKGNRVLVYFAAMKKHIGFYPTSSGVRMFPKELAGYVTTKGAIHLSLTKPIPVALVQKIVKFRVKEDAERARR
jgi:uncharacterized protein YdhG (YjbR/CyaY superfamily)